jgi:hypothetical protein
MNRSITISEHIETLSQCYKNFIESFPKTYLAAEFINDIFDQLFTERFPVNENNLWEIAVSHMLFGLHLSWVESFYLKAAGKHDVGLMTERKAIEFACYISKVSNDNRRAEIWYKHLSNTENKKSFTNEFSIPCCYISNKYSYLRPLLVLYEFSSDFGSHANVNSLVTKYVQNDDDVTSMNFLDEPESVPSGCTATLRIGSFLIDSLLYILKNKINDFENFQEIVSKKDELVKNANLEVYKYLSGEKPNPTIIKEILEGNMDGINQLFEKIKSKCEERNRKANEAVG